jgi:hypothetical protein
MKLRCGFSETSARRGPVSGIAVSHTSGSRRDARLVPRWRISRWNVELDSGPILEGETLLAQVQYSSPSNRPISAVTP